MLRPALAVEFRQYAEYHRHPLNQLTHKLAVPFIVFHVIAMSTWVSLGTPFGFSLTLGHLACAAVIGWYLTLDLGLGALMALLFGLCFPIAAVAPRSVVVGIAVLAWLVQLAGHFAREKRSPAFFTKLLQALIGPLYLVACFVGIWPANRGEARA